MTAKRATNQPIPFAVPPEAREDVRTWLQLVKAVLPMERSVNRLFHHEFGQSLARFDVLSQLERALPGGLPVGVLAERLIASAGNITRLVSRMEEEGLVTRRAADGDRRSHIVVVTPKGNEIYQAMSERHTAWAADRMAVLSEAEKATIKPILQKLREPDGVADHVVSPPFRASNTEDQ
jgi:DNA-binding MarR family transcriptional regulator